MNKTMTITVIVLVAVIMGMSAVVPIIPEAYARHGGPDPPQAMCDGLSEFLERSTFVNVKLAKLLEHCSA